MLSLKNSASLPHHRGRMLKHELRIASEYPDTRATTPEMSVSKITNNPPQITQTISAVIRKQADFQLVGGWFGFYGRWKRGEGGESGAWHTVPYLESPLVFFSVLGSIRLLVCPLDTVSRTPPAITRFPL